MISSSCTVAAAPNEPFLPLRATTRTRSAFGSSGTSHDPEREINAPARERKLEAVPEALAHVEDGIVAQGAGRVSASRREDVQVEEGRQGRRQVSARRVARVSSTGPYNGLRTCIRALRGPARGGDETHRRSPLSPPSLLRSRTQRATSRTRTSSSYHSMLSTTCLAVTGRILCVSSVRGGERDEGGSALVRGPAHAS